MKKSFSILLLTFSVLNLFGQKNLTTTNANEKSFPTNIHEGSIKEIEKFDGEIVALMGQLKKLKSVETTHHFTDSKLVMTIIYGQF